MRPEGLMVAQSGPTGPSFYEQCFSAVAKTVSSVFPVVALSETFVPSFGSTWGFVVGSLGPDPASLPIREVDRRLSQRVTGDLRYFDGTTLKGMVSVPKYLRASVAAETAYHHPRQPLFVV